MTVGTLVRVKTKCMNAVGREGDVGVIVKVSPPHGIYETMYSVLFWDEKIDRVSAVCLEVV